MFGQKSVLATLLIEVFVLVPGALLLARRYGLSRWRVLCAALAGAGLSLVPATTLGRGGLGPIAWRSCLFQPGLSLASPEAKLNFLLFAPAVCFGVLASRRLIAALMAAMVLSLLVELTQSLTGLGVCQTSDVVRNFSGAVVAGSIAWLISALVGRFRGVRTGRLARSR